MTLQNLDELLKTVCPETYELAAPKGATRYVVWAQYGSNTVYGGDATVLDVPRVQIDIVYQNLADDLPERVKGVLSAWCIPYAVEDHGYDDEFAAIRCILSVEVW